MAPPVSMHIDSAPFLHFIISFIIVGVVLIIAIISGATGPAFSVTEETTLFKCSDGSHVWDPDKCQGTPFTPGKAFVFDFPTLVPMNRFWKLSVEPYNVKVQGGQKNTVESTQFFLYANITSRDKVTDPWSSEVHHYKKINVMCPVTSKNTGNDIGWCTAFIALTEEAIDHRHHQIRFTIEDVYTPSGSVSFGDMRFKLTFGSMAFSNMEMGINITFLITSLGAFVVFLYMLRNYIYNGWTYQQMWTMVLLLAVIFYNNPFFALEYLIPGTFFLFLDALFKNCYIGLMLLFWMVSIEELRETETFKFTDCKHIPKYVICGLFVLFSIIAFTGESISIKQDPIGVSMHHTPVYIAFFVLAVLSFVAGLGYIGYLGYCSIKAIASNKVMFTRLCFIAIPSAFVALCIFIGCCADGYGTGATGTFEFIFFAFLYNLYTWILMFGFWPVSGRFTTSNARLNDETSSIFAGRKVTVDDNDDEEGTYGDKDEDETIPITKNAEATTEEVADDKAQTEEVNPGKVEESK